MSVQLLDKTRKINKLLHNNNSTKVVFNDICKEKEGLWTLINRNPTINEKGLPFVKVKKCHDVYNDFTMDLPPDILTGLGADSAKAASLSHCGPLWQ